MAKRKSMSLRNRFNVFKRDEFKCKYCGRGVPYVVLEVDHIIPVSKGGDNSQNNLITSCFDCNRGKGAELLDVKPENITDTLLAEIELKKEKQKQIKYIDKELRKIRNAEANIIIDIEKFWFDHFFDGDCYGNSFFSGEKLATIKKFLTKLTPEQIKNYMDIARNRKNYEGESWRYFCGCCWNKIKDKKPSW